MSLHIELILILPQIFKVYGINAAAVNGTQSAQERDQTVAAFQKDARCRVLLLSNVGAVGLNLNAATVVILFVSEFETAGPFFHLCAGSVLVAHAGKPSHWARLAAWSD